MGVNCDQSKKNTSQKAHSDKILSNYCSFFLKLEFQIKKEVSYLDNNYNYYSNQLNLNPNQNSDQESRSLIFFYIFAYALKMEFSKKFIQKTVF
jgi:hypothetical protein